MNSTNIRRPRHLWPEIATVTRPLLEFSMFTGGVLGGERYLLVAQTRDDGSGMGAVMVPEMIYDGILYHADLTAEELAELRQRLRTLELPPNTAERKLLFGHRGSMGHISIWDGEREAAVHWRAVEPEGWGEVFEWAGEWEKEIRQRAQARLQATRWLP